MAREKKALHEDFEFPVVRENMIQSNQKDTGYDALYNGNNGEPISVVSRKYKLVEHKTVNDFAINLFNNKGIEFEETKTEVTYNGTKFYKEFQFPEYAIDPAVLTGVKNSALDGVEDNDGYSLRVILQNSYDRSKAFTFTFGAYRLVCSNGLVIGKALDTFKIRHMTTPDFSKIGDSFVKNLETSVDWIKTFYTQLNNTFVDNQLINEAIVKSMGIRLQREAISYMMEKDLIDAEYNEDARIYQDINLKQEVTGYMLYNVITELITHKVYGLHRQNEMLAKLNKIMM